MPKRPASFSFTIVVDSNALFPRDVSNVVSPKFDELWEECSALGKLSLLVPEVVRGERAYQLVAAAEKAVQNAARNFNTIGKVSGRATPALPTTKELRAAVEARFEQWISEYKASIAPIPYDKVPWKRVVNDSIWRVKPFVPAGEGDDSEKGFRDCLILETLREILHARTADSVVFVCNDTVLREAAIEQFDAKVFTAYAELRGFASYLKLSHEKLNQEFAQSLIQKAPFVFYKEQDSECVYRKFNVAQLIATRFQASLDFLIDKDQPPFLALLTKPQPLSGLTSGVFQPASAENISTDTTEFDSLTPPNIYRWKTRLRFVRLFRQPNFTQMLQCLDWLNEKIRIAKFDVLWKATVDDDENFSNTALENIEFVDQTTEIGWMNKLKYGFTESQPPKPQF